MNISRTQRALAATAAVTLTIGLTGCSSISDKIGEFAGEKVAEKVVEGATGGKADINVDGDGETSFSIDTGDGGFSMQTGKFVDEWPDNLPYPSDYQIVSSILTKDEGETTLTSIIVTEESFDSVTASLTAAFESRGFQMRVERTDVNMGTLHIKTFSFERTEFNI